MLSAFPQEDWAQGYGPNAKKLGIGSDPILQAQLSIMARAPGAMIMDADSAAFPAGLARRDYEIMRAGGAEQRRVFVQRLFGGRRK